MADQQPRTPIWIPVAKAVLPFVLFVAVRPLLGLRWPPNPLASSFLWWVVAAIADIASILPFALFGAGVVLARKLGRSGRLLRAAAMVGILVGAVSYVLGAWVRPVMTDQWIGETEALVELGFTPRTPVAIARHLRFVEANPPEEYNLWTDSPDQWPPNFLRRQLHSPVAMVVFGLINVLLGVLTAELTVGLTRGRRRNACLGIGFAGAIAFVACDFAVAPGPVFARGGAMLPGIVAAWAPLAIPVAEAFLLAHLVQRRRYG